MIPLRLTQVWTDGLFGVNGDEDEAENSGDLCSRFEPDITVSRIVGGMHEPINRRGLDVGRLRQCVVCQARCLDRFPQCGVEGDLLLGHRRVLSVGGW